MDHNYKVMRKVAATVFSWEAVAQETWENLGDGRSPVWSRGEAPLGKLKQFEDTVDTFRLHKRSEFKTFTQFTS